MPIPILAWAIGAAVVGAAGAVAKAVYDDGDDSSSSSAENERRRQEHEAECERKRNTLTKRIDALEEETIEDTYKYLHQAALILEKDIALIRKNSIEQIGNTFDIDSITQTSPQSFSDSVFGKQYSTTLGDIVASSMLHHRTDTDTRSDVQPKSEYAAFLNALLDKNAMGQEFTRRELGSLMQGLTVLESFSTGSGPALDVQDKETSCSHTAALERLQRLRSLRDSVSSAY